jgi:flagellar hook-basal body complex protein FliE
MSMSIQAAVNAYNSAAKINSQIDAGQDKADIGQVAQFANVAKTALSNTAQKLGTAEQTATRALTNKADLTDVVTAITNAEVTLKSVIAVRDRLLSAHQEIMRMPI